ARNSGPRPGQRVLRREEFNHLSSLESVKRLDEALVERGLCLSREKAKRAILAGTVWINDRRAEKASQPVKESDTLSIDQPERFVSRGGHKLDHALNEFQIEVSGLTAVDMGASTGGFTDCL